MGDISRAGIPERDLDAIGAYSLHDPETPKMVLKISPVLDSEWLQTILRINYELQGRQLPDLRDDACVAETVVDKQSATKGVTSC